MYVRTILTKKYHCQHFNGKAFPLQCSGTRFVWFKKKSEEGLLPSLARYKSHISNRIKYISVASLWPAQRLTILTDYLLNFHKDGAQNSELPIHPWTASIKPLAGWSKIEPSFLGFCRLCSLGEIILQQNRDRQAPSGDTSVLWVPSLDKLILRIKIENTC